MRTATSGRPARSPPRTWPGRCGSTARPGPPPDPKGESCCESRCCAGVPQQRVGQRVQQEVAGPEVGCGGPDPLGWDEFKNGPCGRGGPAAYVQSHGTRRAQPPPGEANLDSARAAVAILLDGQRNRLGPMCSSLPCPVRCQLSSTATHRSNGISMIRGNDSQLTAEYVPALLLAPASSAFCRS